MQVEGSGTGWITKPDGAFRRPLEAKVLTTPLGVILEIVVRFELATKRSPFASKARLPGPLRSGSEEKTLIDPLEVIFEIVLAL
jgi:hypothetical protein